MTRPGFLVITAVACVLGISVAALCGHGIHMWTTLAALVLAVLIHAAANVINDYHDALSGANDTNTQGLFPFTGGARLIQDGHVSVRDTYDSPKPCSHTRGWLGGIHPEPTLWGLVSMPLSVWTFVLLLKNADLPRRLAPAIV
jgi:hypothetical protein